MAKRINTGKSINKRLRFGRKGLAAALVAVLATVSLAIVSISMAQSDVGLDQSRARVAKTKPGSALTPPSNAEPAAIAADYLRGQGRSADVLASLRTAKASADAKGISHVRFEQQVGGLTVYGGYVKAAVNADGELVHLIDHLYDVRKVRPSGIDAAQALSVAVLNLYPEQLTAFRPTKTRGNTTSFDGGSFFYRDPAVTAVVLPMTDGSMERGWLVETWTAATNDLKHTIVSGNGRVLYVESRTANDSYNVFTEDPGKNAQTVVAGPGTGNAESPSGWLSGTQRTFAITGNNTRTYLDTDANNAADSGGTTVTDGNFLTAADLTMSPSTSSNKNVAIQNLFYLTNVVHDTLYRHGFDEAAGNFQTDNFSKGGSGNDPVNAEAQDGSGMDNANFSTPSDGSSPRMQMYLWSGTTSDGLATANSVDYSLYGSAFGPAITNTDVSGPLQNMSPADGCTAAASGSLNGKIAVIDRGTCDFTVKVLNAQKAGAIGAIIANNVDTNPFGPGGSDRKVKIPSGMVSRANGATLHTAPAGTAVRLHKNTATPLRLDGDLDADIVFHEYGHGLTWRMIGGMSGPLAGAIGEGASDVNAFLMNGDDRIGEYAYADPAGIRRYPYTNYPLTYSSVDGAEVHNDGEIYAAAMWRVLQNYQDAGLTADDLQGDFVDGMNYTPPTPAFEDMRDGMLQSVAGTGRECLIWRGFAATGIGVGADGTVNRRGKVVITESTAVPTGCQ